MLLSVTEPPLAVQAAPLAGAAATAVATAAAAVESPPPAAPPRRRCRPGRCRRRRWSL